MKRLAPFALALALTVTAGCGGGVPTAVTIGEPAPTFSLPALEGGELASGSLEGKPVILNFWASWCQPCRTEIPALNQLAEREDVQVIGIALDERGEQTVRPFADQLDIQYPVLLGNEEVFRKFDGFSIPYTLVLDASRQVVAIHRGPVGIETLEADLARSRA